MGNTERCWKERSQAGRYLFEFALVLFGTAVFIVGASDVARIFHARGAVRAGVTEGLRCLYPTDAGCSGQSMGNGWFPNDRFTARIAGSGFSNLYELPRVSYNLSSVWFNEPVSEASFATKQLTGVTLTQPRDAYRQYQVLFPGTAHAVYLLKTQELPRVQPGSSSNRDARLAAAERVLNPRFIDPDSGAPRSANKVIPGEEINDGAALSINASRVAAGVPGKVVTKSFAISVADIFGDTSAWTGIKNMESAHGFIAACYQGSRSTLPGGSQQINWPTSGAPAACAYRSDPTALYDGRSLKVPIMIHVTGSASVSKVINGVYGKVTMRIQQDGGADQALGGREFSRLRPPPGQPAPGPRQWGNFVVRGAGYDDRRNIDVSQSYRDDCVEAQYDKDADGDPRECRKYVTMPLIEVGKEVNLIFTLTWRNDGASATPDVNLEWTPGEVRIFYPKFQATHEQRSCGYSTQPNSCGTSVAPMQTSFRTTNLDQAFSYSDRPDTTTCGRKNPDGYQPSIPNALEAFRSEIQAGARALQPIAFWSKGTSSDRCLPTTSQARCNETAREHMKGCEPEYTFPADAVANCTLNDYQSNRDVISNPQFLSVNLNKKEQRKRCTGEPFPECTKPHLVGKPSAFLGAVSNGCPVAQVVRPEPAPYGPMYRNTCTDLLPGLVEKYRKEHNVPPSINIPTGEKAEKPVITDKEPNRCWEQKKITEETQSTWICAEASSYAVANDCCKRYGPDKCSLERVSLSNGGGNGDGFDQIIEGARQRTLETVQAAYPRARMDMACGQTPDGPPTEADCIDIQAGPEANGTQARVQASMRVPLALLDWFGFEDNTLVQYEESRMLESALVGEAS